MVVIGQGAPPRWTAPDGPWTEPDLHLFPQDGHRYEIVCGSLHVTPPADDAHETIVNSLVTVLRAAAPEDWWVCDRLGIAWADSNLVPDVTVLRPRSSGASWANPADIALVVEIEAPASRRYDRLLKPALYAEAGITTFWRIEPGPEPVLHTYALLDGGFARQETIHGVDPVRVDAPFPIRVAPQTWQ
ncbi:Uma2 family endonuclease [Actinoplanes sp. TFC3]|uniref:Uma2 family endonuclease n=1 Tax=Actinoplanes sp. TFC3 TaxID=1710355 RepID=UPI0008344097|nr:Uma2 family endonuclease [Actinoplanes sp. TFC3]